MSPLSASARTGAQITLAQAVVIAADFAPGDELRRQAGAVIVAAVLTAGQWLLERRIGHQLFVKRQTAKG